MRDAYKTINKAFVPTKNDIKSYIDVIDMDNDGIVTQPDIEEMTMRFLIGEDFGKSYINSNSSPYNNQFNQSVKPNQKSPYVNSNPNQYYSKSPYAYEPNNRNDVKQTYERPVS